MLNMSKIDDSRYLDFVLEALPNTYLHMYIIVDTYLICVMPFDQRLSANAVSNREYICGSRNCHQRPNVILYNLA